MLRDIFEEQHWQMRPSERAALKGVLAELAPSLAIEIGTAEGGSLRRIAAAAARVHAFDVALDEPELERLPNVTFHIGDSHELLPKVLAELDAQKTNVDFVLVDGDHTSQGVQRDLVDLLESAAISRTLILLHDTANNAVRTGIEAALSQDWPKITWVDLDWLPGYLARDTSDPAIGWAGFGLIVVDASAEQSAAAAKQANYAYRFTDLLPVAGAK